MHSKSDNIDDPNNRHYDNTDEIIEELFNFFLSKYQVGLETQVRVSYFIFDCVDLLYYKCHKINFKLDSSDGIRKKKATISPKNNDDHFFQNAATVALNHEKIESHSEILSNIKPFINNYN